MNVVGPPEGAFILSYYDRSGLANIKIRFLHKISFPTVYNIPGSQNDHQFSLIS